MTVKVRRAIFKDLFAIDALLAQSFEENGHVAAPEYPAAYHWCLDAIAQFGVTVAVEELEAGKERVIGVVMLEAKALPTGPSQPFLELAHFYVHPDKRATSVDDKTTAEALIESARVLAHAYSAATGQVARLVWGYNTGDDRSAAKEKLVERSGFERIGANFVYIPAPDDYSLEDKAA